MWYLKELFINDYVERFCDINGHALCEKKHAQGNQILFLTKDLSKAIMKRSRMCNNFLKNRTEENKPLHTK